MKTPSVLHIYASRPALGGKAGNGLISNANMISKVYFPCLMVLYVSPVGFSSAIVPEQWRLLYSLNPMIGVIDGFRWAILGGNTQLYWLGFLLSLFLVMAILVTGIVYDSLFP